MDHAPGCRPTGSGCTASADCCPPDACIGGVCAEPPPCRSLGATCATAADCCSGACVDGQGAPG